MLAQPRFARGRLVALPLAAALTFTSACDKVPLLAPGGTVISIFATANTVPVNGEIEIVATAIENGTTSTPTTPRRHPDHAGNPDHADDAHDAKLDVDVGRWNTGAERNGHHLYDDARAD